MSDTRERWPKKSIAVGKGVTELFLYECPECRAPFLLMNALDIPLQTQPQVDALARIVESVDVDVPLWCVMAIGETQRLVVRLQPKKSSHTADSAEAIMALIEACYRTTHRCERWERSQ